MSTTHEGFNYEKLVKYLGTRIHEIKLTFVLLGFVGKYSIQRCYNVSHIPFCRVHNGSCFNGQVYDIKVLVTKLQRGAFFLYTSSSYAFVQIQYVEY